MKQINMVKKLSLLIIPTYMSIFALKLHIEWTIFQFIIAIIIAFDVRNGFITNMLYENLRSKSWLRVLTKQSLVPFHAHTLIVGMVFYHSAYWTVFWYVMLNLCRFTVNRFLRHRSNLFPLLVTITAIAINIVFIRPPQLFEWIIPVLFIQNVLNKPKQIPVEYEIKNIPY